MNGKLTLSDWFDPATVSFWHASVRITVDGHDNFMHEAFGAENCLKAFDASISDHFAAYPSAISAHKAMDHRIEENQLLPVSGRKTELKQTEVNSKSISSTLVDSEFNARDSVDISQNGRDADYYRRVVECFHSLSGRPIHGFVITKEVFERPTTGRSGFSVAAFYVSDTDHNDLIIVRAIEQLSMELLNRASTKSMELARKVKLKFHQAEALQRLRTPLILLERALSDITQSYATVNTALIGPGAFLWHDQCANRSVTESIYNLSNAGDARTSTVEWLKTIDAALRCAHDAEGLNGLSKDVKQLHHRVVTLLFAGVSKDRICEIKDDLKLTADAFFEKHEGLNATAFVEHFFRCKACGEPQTSIDLFNRLFFKAHVYALDDNKDFMRWIGLQLLAAGFKVCPQDLATKADGDPAPAIEFLLTALNASESKGGEDKSITVESLSMFFANSVLLHIGSGYTFKRVVFNDDSCQFGYEFVANSRPQSELEPLQRSVLTDDQLQSEIFARKKFSIQEVTSEEGASKTVMWGLI